MSYILETVDSLREPAVLLFDGALSSSGAGAAGEIEVVMLVISVIYVNELKVHRLMNGIGLGLLKRDARAVEVGLLFCMQLFVRLVECAEAKVLSILYVSL